MTSLFIAGTKCKVLISLEMCHFLIDKFSFRPGFFDERFFERFLPFFFGPSFFFLLFFFFQTIFFPPDLIFMDPYTQSTQDQGLYLPFWHLTFSPTDASQDDSKLKMKVQVLLSLVAPFLFWRQFYFFSSFFKIILFSLPISHGNHSI